MSRQHPIFDATFNAYWTERQIDPSWVRAMAAGKIPTSRTFAKACLLSWDIPLSAWKDLEPEYALTSDGNSTTLDGMGSMSSPELAQGLSRSRSRSHPFVNALYNHPDPKRRMAVKTWAEKNGFKVPTVASWFAKGKGARRIPLSAAKLIEKQLGVPATLEVWTNGITTTDR